MASLTQFTAFDEPAHHALLSRPHLMVVNLFDSGLVVIGTLLKPYDGGQMRCYPVSTRINYLWNDDEACSTPVELAQTQNLLF